MHHIAQIEIRGYHCDAYGHVNNARYLELLEESRWQGLKMIDENETLMGGRIGYFITRIELDFLRGLKMGDVAQIGFKLLNFGEHEVHVAQEIRRKSDEKLCTRARITFVLMDMVEQKKTELTDEIKTLFLKFA